MITKEKATEFIRLSDELERFNKWLEPFEETIHTSRDKPRVGFRTFFRNGLKSFWYFQDRGYNKTDEDMMLTFDENLQKYISDAVKKRRDEIKDELSAVANER